MIPKILMVHNYSSWGGNLATVLALSEGLRRLGFTVEMAFPRSEAYVTRFADTEWNWGLVYPSSQYLKSIWWDPFIIMEKEVSW